MLGNAPVAAVLTSSDLSRTKAFYEGMLGLRVMMENEGVMFFEAGGGTNLVVYLRPGTTISEATAAGFQVADVEETVEGLTARGVVFEIYDMPGIQTDERGVADLGSEGGHGAWFKDPDGNILALAEM
jgi:catechol 2,3-dioxygenase-like lactoylglutathione lyase family enzyme